jgi:hypothetical protein
MMKKMTMTILLILMFSICKAPEWKTLYLLRTVEESKTLNWSNIDWWMDYYQIKAIPYVKAQIWLETGNLTSRFCKEHNNLFGMKLAHKRPTTAIGQRNKMAYYADWIESIEDYKIWQDQYYNGGDYLSFLQSHGYAEDIWYKWKLKRLIN